MKSIVHNIDCMIGMKGTVDKYYDLAVCDVNYGISVCKMSLGKGGGLYRGDKKYKIGNWDDDSPAVEYFDKVIQASKNQIFFGANHFISKIPYNSSCWIIWDKNNGGSDFADCELAWTSFKTPSRIFKYTWSGFRQERMGDKKEIKIHPTQKPITLYDWILKNYAKPGDKILDTHVGSGSSRIACYRAGLDFIGYEIDYDYWLAQEKRFKDFTSQYSMFEKESISNNDKQLSFTEKI